ncbi:aspartate 1-decarboxylase [Paracrocinitomix mangrovi]|uniref:aspartate 1-decarboxylase n=1 Tax=Paracrocinitomix mangrovi TaxID=2862509 RepID=UPI001C8DF9A9|nr:aspartate 1-decarboxylase [Paracrocinitomix mangrovi]UKN03410.1 aspartate 1-decarboxylase [Paracrocinitomix mangrovi]
MLRTYFKSKIHRVKVTEAELDYIGSITIDKDLLEAADMMDGEKVQVLDLENGERLETYIIEGERGSGVICMNGPAAHKIHVGHTVIVITYAMMTAEEAKDFKPTVIFPNEHNKLD